MAWVGSAVLLLVWALECRAGLINPWDIWAQPLLAVTLCGHAAALNRWPQHGRWIRVSGGLMFTAYLVLSVLMLLLSGEARPDSYQFVSTLYWLPLGYGVCFLFLPPRWALGVACAMFGITFGPVAVSALAGGAPTRWHAEFQTLVGVADYQPDDSLLQRADRALYRAKAEGRNRTHRTHPPTSA
jgi:hypothetical protein